MLCDSRLARAPGLRAVRILVLLAAALLAYLLFLQFIFPGYIAPPAAYHPDMYSSVEFVANGWNFPFFLRWPRPVYFETLLFAGHFGFEGSLVFLTAIVLADLALALALLERFVLRRPIPWWLALATFLLAMAGPGFYAQPAFDVGYHLALFFGLLGIYAWESLRQRYTVVALLLTGVCFALSTLANEGFIPALMLYGIVAAVRERRRYAVAAVLLALPAVAIAISFADGQFTHSPFVALHAAKDYPYRIDFSWHSLLYCARYYLSSLANPAFFALLIACGVGLWYNRRLLIGLALAVCALALYLPYVILPNHLSEMYQWPPMPLLMLLVPLAWTPSPVLSRSRFAANAAIALVLVGAIAFQTTQYRDAKNAYRAVLELNRQMIAALRSHARPIARAHAILIRGLTLAAQPSAQSAQFVSRELGFSGEWTVETEPGNADYRNYDLVVDFDAAGHIVHTYRPSRFAHLPPATPPLFYPPGIIAPADPAAAVREGLYPGQTQAQCCFLSAAASLSLDKAATATSATFEFYVPDVPPFADAPEIVIIAFNGVRAGAPVALAPGLHDVHLALPSRFAGARAVTAALRMSVSYVPREIGLNGDARRLSIMLLRVRYR
ncbi:MAG: hypothetical protein ACYCX6_08780 [Vulcanimicrobiaceae bacterium]